MIKITTENIFTPTEGDNTFVVHGTNCQGVMGAGIAATIKKLYPGAFDLYQQQHKQTEGLVLGNFTAHRTKDGFWILNLQTQENIGGVRACSYDAIDFGFRNIADAIDERNSWLGRPIENHTRAIIRFPLIGCGLGGGIWDIVGPIIDVALPDSHFVKQLHILSPKDMPQTSNVTYTHTF